MQQWLEAELMLFRSLLLTFFSHCAKHHLPSGKWIPGAHLPSCLSYSASKPPALGLQDLEKKIVQTLYSILSEEAQMSSLQLKAFLSRSSHFMLPWASFLWFIFFLWRLTLTISHLHGVLKHLVLCSCPTWLTYCFKGSDARSSWWKKSCRDHCSRNTVKQTGAFYLLI